MYQVFVIAVFPSAGITKHPFFQSAIQCYYIHLFVWKCSGCFQLVMRNGSFDDEAACLRLESFGLGESQDVSTYLESRQIHSYMFTFFDSDSFNAFTDEI